MSTKTWSPTLWNKIAPNTKQSKSKLTISASTTTISSKVMLFRYFQDMEISESKELSTRCNVIKDEQMQYVRIKEFYVFNSKSKRLVDLRHVVIHATAMYLKYFNFGRNCMRQYIVKKWSEAFVPPPQRAYERKWSYQLKSRDTATFWREYMLWMLPLTTKQREFECGVSRQILSSRDFSVILTITFFFFKLLLR